MIDCSSVEHEKDLLQPRPYWKEFRFDLTPLPQGETVTAAEFRIYKTVTVGQRGNRTLHISVYEIQKEKRPRLYFLVVIYFISCPYSILKKSFFTLQSDNLDNLQTTSNKSNLNLLILCFREPELVLLDIQSVPAGQEGWLAFDVTTASNHWLLQPRSNLGIRLYVETEDGEHLIRHNIKSNNKLPLVSGRCF